MKEPSDSQFASRARSRRTTKALRRRPVQSRSQATVDIILEATIRVLIGHGFRRLTTTRVAAVAGVSVGTLYQYFPDKGALVTALLQRFLDGVVAVVLAAVRQGRERPLDEALAGLVHAYLGAKRADLEAALALRATLEDVDYAPLVRVAARRVSAEVALLLRRRVAQPARAARVLVAAIEGAVWAALDERPALLGSPAFERELVALAVGYLRARTDCAA
jgi:AcrR family transcriptional regulator